MRTGVRLHDNGIITTAIAARSQIAGPNSPVASRTAPSADGASDARNVVAGGLDRAAAGRGGRCARLRRHQAQRFVPALVDRLVQSALRRGTGLR